MSKFVSASVAVATLLSSCTEGPPPEVEWRREMIVQIGTAASVPSYADRHCLDAISPTAQRHDEVLLLRFRVGRGRYWQAFPTAPNESWKVGDTVMFDSQTCQIKRYRNAIDSSS